MLNLKPKPPTRNCRECGTNLAGRQLNALYCKPCRAERDRESASRAGRAWYERKRQAKQHKERPNGPIPGRQYAGQMQTKDGRHYLINFRGRWVRIEKRCMCCKKYDDTVAGNWAPIYSVCDTAGNEKHAVLLCVPCYNEQCEMYTETLREERKAG